jgi:hypothetical protein
MVKYGTKVVTICDKHVSMVGRATACSAFTKDKVQLVQLVQFDPRQMELER